MAANPETQPSRDERTAGRKPAGVRTAVILAGGNGTRLHPITLGVNKHLLPVFDRPMFHYPLSFALRMGCERIVIVCKDADKDAMEATLKPYWNPERATLSFVSQNEPKGLAHALAQAQPLVGENPFAVLCGDNAFLLGAQGTEAATSLAEKFRCKLRGFRSGCHLFLQPCPDPSQVGVATRLSDAREGSASPNAAMDESRRSQDPSDWQETAFGPFKDDPIVKLTEKPQNTTFGRLAVTGLWLFGPEAFGLIETLKPSKRKELEMTDLCRIYMEKGKLTYSMMGRDVLWRDCGTFRGLQDASKDTEKTRRIFPNGLIEEAWGS